MMNATYKKIGERVKHFRINRKMSQEQLAEGICSRQTISILENGQHFPSTDIMKQIAEKLSVPFHEIMVDEAKDLKAKVQLDLIKLYVETGDYANAFPLIEELEVHSELLSYQSRDLIFYKAECLMRLGRSRNAGDLLTDLQQRLERERENDDYLMASLYDKLGTAYFLSSNYLIAYAHYTRAYQLTVRFSQYDLLAARITYNLGMVCRNLNRNSEAVKNLTRAHSFFSEISDVPRIAQSLFEMGIAYRNKEELERAKNCFEESLSIFQSLNFIKMARMVRQTYAYLVLSQIHLKSSIQELQKCASEYEQAGDILSLIYTYACVAKLLIKQTEYSTAEEYLDLACKYITLDKTDAKFPEYAFVYAAKALYFLSINQYEKCIEFSHLSADIFVKIGLEREAAEVLKLSTDAYRLQGKYEQVDEVSQQIIRLLSQPHDDFISKLEVFS